MLSTEKDQNLKQKNHETEMTSLLDFPKIAESRDSNNSNDDDHNDRDNDNNLSDDLDDTDDDNDSNDDLDDTEDDNGSSNGLDDSDDDNHSTDEDLDSSDDKNDGDGQGSDRSEKYKFVIENGAIVSFAEIENGFEEFEDIENDESFTISNDFIVKTEVKKYGTQTTRYTDTDGDGIYSVVEHTWSRSDNGLGSDARKFEDWYEYDGRSDDYDVVIAGSSVELRDKETAELVSNYEVADRVIFNDKGYATASDDNALKAYRIYQAAFDRDPMQGDTAGLGYWVSRVDAGMSVEEIAARFIDSAEFKDVYGEKPSNAEFLTKLYENILNRAPDASGYTWWLNELNNNPSRSWAKVLAEFSESGENQTNVAAIVGQGIVFDVVV